MERTRKVREKYYSETGEFAFVSTCPFCNKRVKMVDGAIVEKCSHYAREGHGCGGTIFVFQEEGE